MYTCYCGMPVCFLDEVRWRQSLNFGRRFLRSLGGYLSAPRRRFKEHCRAFACLASLLRGRILSVASTDQSAIIDKHHPDLWISHHGALCPGICVRDGGGWGIDSGPRYRLSFCLVSGVFLHELLFPGAISAFKGDIKNLTLNTRRFLSDNCSAMHYGTISGACYSSRLSVYPWSDSSVLTLVILAMRHAYSTRFLSPKLIQRK